ncbi:hypothetical protein NQ176_g10178 [Zarea fungicola]|uniref:Uncharacterized protein n=1 Tax=Zarea fungicola TaxID=93591 RepID=A0ACC1MIB7_9HYPO|nr:hypothetical protein NQ176_g10178 [Lecanicillium fungicola]
MEETMAGITDEEIAAYLERATLIEALIVTDRWVWLKEQDEVKDAWVETVFDFKQSPRNMVVVGIKK